MGIESKTVAAAQSFAEFDEEALLVLLGKQHKAIEMDTTLAADPTLNPDYDSTHMGLIEDLKVLGRRVAKRWNKELHKIVCGSSDDQTRKKLMDALNVGEAAAIAAVAGILLAIAPAAVTAPLSVLLVKSFLMPAKDELCDAWQEALEA